MSIKEETQVSKPKVLVIGPVAPPFGGIAIYIKYLLNSHLKEKYNLVFFNTNFRQKRATLRGWIYKLLCPFLLLYVLLKERPQLVHIPTSSYWGFWRRISYLMLLKFFERKIFLHIQGGKFDDFYERSNPFLKRLIRFSLNICDGVAVLSMRWYSFFSKIVGKHKLVIIGNGVPSANYRCQANSDGDFALPKEAFIILFFGGLLKGKGVYDLLKAIPICLEEDKSLLFVFAGGGKEQRRMHAICVEENIQNNVLFLGNVSERRKIQLYIASDVFILPTYAEGLPLTILEAMAAGLPIISTPVGGIPEIIEEDVNGFLVDPGDYQAMAKKILFLRSNKDIREEIRHNNIKEIRETYDIEIVAGKIDEEWMKILRNSD